MAGDKRTHRSDRPRKRRTAITIEGEEIVPTRRPATGGDDDQELRPSAVTDRFWIWAERKRGKYPEPTERSGKWLIYVALRNVDEVWAKIRNAVEAGKLGDRAKVATTRTSDLRERLGGHPSKARVICVYTYDWTDEADVRRVREALRQLGIEGRIPFKADEDTLAGKYKATEAGRISKYFE